MKKLLIAGLLLIVTTVAADTFVSFNGNFKIELPDDWIQIDYNTADLYLRRSATDASSLQYEAVFAPATSSPFFEADYLILKIDTLEWLYEYQEDSIVEDVENSFGQKLKSASVWDQLADYELNRLVYDKDNRIISIITDILQGEEIIKRNLFIKKMHDKGAANFYFFAPEARFDASTLIFANIIKSFSTENLIPAPAKEEVKVAEFENDSDTTQTIIIAVVVTFLIVIAILGRTKFAARRKEK